MVNILSALEQTLNFPGDISSNLKSHVSRVEGYLSQASRVSAPAEYSSTATGDLTLPSNLGPLFTNGPFEAPSFTPDFTFQLPEDHQAQLRTHLTADWPLELGFLDAFGDGSGW